MRTFFVSLAGAFVALVIFNVLAFFVVMGFLASATTEQAQPRNLVLSLDLRTPLSDSAPTGGFAAFSGEDGFVDILTKLDAAASDPDVKGLFIRAPQMGIGSSRAEELRSAVLKLREAGKHVTAHSQGTFTTGPSGYRAIAAADETWIQPGSDMMVTGISLETLFLGKLFENLSIVPEIEALYEYKNAPNTFKETDYTEPHREAMTALAESIWSSSLSDIATDRGLNAADLRTLLENGPLSAESVVEAGLMDKLGWPEDAELAARSKDGSGNIISVTAYQPPSVSARAPQIAVIGGEGPITTGGSGGGAFNDSSGFASDVIAASILQAAGNDRVKALVFRVDSPGGSPAASDQIWRAIERAKEGGKPVVVSMGSAAASGGYYVSTGADYIFANPSTVTGSIGIFGGKQTIAGALERIGVNPRAITVGGEFTDAYGTDLFTDSQREQLIASLKRGYDRFTSLVAEGRGFSASEVDSVARGRVWSGSDALENGLVDELGGFVDAITKAKELAGIEADTDVRLAYYPRRKTGFEALEDIFGTSAEAARAASVIGALAGDERLDSALIQMRLLQNERAQAVGPIVIER
ncbi:MAG: signal peptide peptidase SppA [Pseudomonadota bacterium]